MLVWNDKFVSLEAKQFIDIHIIVTVDSIIKSIISCHGECYSSSSYQESVRRDEEPVIIVGIYPQFINHGRKYDIESLNEIAFIDISNK